MKVIAYKKEDNSISIIYPSIEVLRFASLEQVAEKDVPYNLPYWFVSEDDIPTDRTYRDAWEIDESYGDPDGFGGVSNVFDSELLIRYKESLRNDQY